MTYDEEVAKIEEDLDWTLDDASNCMCNVSPVGPCGNCWELGWRIGGINVAIDAAKESGK